MVPPASPAAGERTDEDAGEERVAAVAGTLRTLSCVAAGGAVGHMTTTAAAALSCRLAAQAITVEPPVDRGGAAADVALVTEACSDAFAAPTLLPPPKEDGSALSGAPVQVCGYGVISEGRHVLLLLCQSPLSGGAEPTTAAEAAKRKGEAAAAGSSLVFVSVDDSGAPRLQDPDEEAEREEDGGADAAARPPDSSSHGADKENTSAMEVRPQGNAAINNEEEEEEEGEEGVPQRMVVEVGRLADSVVPRLCICAAREFAVIAVQNKIIVVDLFEM
ncbi:hypothetical protein STCU_10921 [Strigomonas culicis]|uniref:Uncharacterized protein n=1 Tax=Strigomonas culicis TaxID=28005 RepID=S9UQG9_9TRYP|nr:hypothetical protein STCU_10921 [Strigomonas culicis]|eukprot:EPY16896.1 hypothetical protein STCU_10921 [Strigomonas culicis]